MIARLSALPGSADQATAGEVCLVDVREAGGQLRRRVTRAQAERLVTGGVGTWWGYGGRAHVRLHQAETQRGWHGGSRTTRRSRNDWGEHIPARVGSDLEHRPLLRS